ncbi:MAG: hypothetical protein AAGI03_01025 [Pseudomonadota bacterium]
MVRVTQTRLAALLGATALGLVAQGSLGQDAVAVPVGEQPSSVFAPPPGAEGFSVRINGRDVIEDSRVENVARRVDVALAEADVQVVFDGLGAARRLDVEVMGPPRGYAAGDVARVQTALNYPAFVERAELRILDLGGPVGGRLLGVVPVQPNGSASLTVPEGRDIYVVHRVYDPEGRFDETRPVPLSRADDRARADGVEDGATSLARSRIPVHGGAITVSGRGVVRGATVTALGEAVRPDPSGGFVIQRIVPAGTYDVDIAISGAGQQRLDETRRVDVPRSEWFYAGIADITVGSRRNPATGEDESFDRGRFALYGDGRTETGLSVTGSLDTNEGPLDEIFRDLDEKDPASVLDRLDPNDLYPTYGDDSTIVDNTPTDGKLYLRVEKEGNFALWGNFESGLRGNDYVRNERSLYGAQAHYATSDTRANGEAVARVEVYAAQPDRLPQRDTFLGTGGSVYFLERQDIGVGTETISVQLRDPVTNRVIGSTRLEAGVDYDINYVQGVVTLAKPLSSGIGDGSLITDVTTDADLVLVVQYEFTPTSSDLDSFSYGGRAEVWATENLRFGVSGLVEEQGPDEQTLLGADLRLQKGDNTWVQLSFAESDGPGFASTFSADGGLIVETNPAVAGSGAALKLEAQGELAELGLASNGQIRGYYERREEGFSSLDFTVTGNTGDEVLWGFAAELDVTSRLSFGTAVDVYENDVGEKENTALVELGYALGPRTQLDFGISFLDRANSTEVGNRTDLGARVTYAVTDAATLFAYGQKSFAVRGLDSNDRIGLGGSYVWSNGWSLEGEVSDGDQGEGAKVLLGRDDGQGNSIYTGYTLEAGREVSGVSRSGRDLGRVVVGAKRAVDTNLNVFGENTYDAFGRHRALTSAYGLSYTSTDATNYVLAFETGTVRDGDGYDFERYAVSVGASYSDEVLSVSGRLEYRTEDGLIDGSDVSSDTFLVSSNLGYRFSDDARLVAELDYAVTDTDQGSLLDGEYGEFVLGYAFRPVLSDRLNVLARYRYMHDMYGQRVDGMDENGPRQRSHVFSVNALYDLNEQWTLGTKFGYRAAETSPDETSGFTDNDAYLLAGSLTYHVVSKWDALVELRNFTTIQAGTSETSLLMAGYRHFGNNVKLGLGYNFGEFSDDLTDLVQDDRGIFINLVAKY